jgi:hypothetical protein
VQFHQTVDLKRRLLEKGVSVEEVVIADDIHDFLLWRSWQTVTTAVGQFLEKPLLANHHHRSHKSTVAEGRAHVREGAFC